MPKTEWRNSTDFSDAFLRRLVSWVCRELGYPRRNLVGIVFQNRTRTPWSGRARCTPYWGRIVVSVGPESCFPADYRVHKDGFTLGVIQTRLESLVKTTAHEIAQCDNARNRNKSRRPRRGRINYGGSERYTDYRTKQVLTAFRESQELLIADWSRGTPAKPAKKSAVQKRAEAAFAKEKEWAAKLQRAKTALKKWERKAKYYRKNYPDGDYTRQGASRPKTDLAAESGTPNQKE